MFKIFSRSSGGKQPDFSLLQADMHSHLLPGIDDGSPDLDQSVALIKGMYNLGFTRLITTPHIMWDMYRNTPVIIEEKLALVKEALNREQVPVTLHAAAEYFLDEHVQQLLKTQQPLLTISGNMVLVEFSMAFPTHGLKETLFELQMQGYQPVIAHPERYIYLEREKEFYDELKTHGCLFQLNILSLAGYYGKSAQELAQYLVKKNYYDLIGTDLHGTRHLEALKDPSLDKHLQKLLDSGKIRNSAL